MHANTGTEIYIGAMKTNPFAGQRASRNREKCGFCFPCYSFTYHCLACSLMFQYTKNLMIQLIKTGSLQGKFGRSIRLTGGPNKRRPLPGERQP